MGAGPEPFDRDVELNEGYRYTTNAPLSSRLANERLTDATLELVSLTGRTLIDVGCGDGTYTSELARRGSPSEVVGIDPSPGAVEVAARRYPDLRFEVGDAAWLEATAEHNAYVLDLERRALAGVAPNNAEEQRHIIFDPIPRVDGIESSGDPLLEPRAAIYLASRRRRRGSTEVSHEMYLSTGI